MVFFGDRQRQTWADGGGVSYGMGGVDKRLEEGNLNLNLMEEEANGHSKP